MAVSYTHMDTVLLPMMVFVHVTPKERMEVISFSTVSRYMVMRGESTPAVIPDVLVDEPKPISPLIDLPECVLTPHLGADTTEAQPWWYMTMRRAACPTCR